MTVYGGAIRDKVGNVDDQRRGDEAEDDIRPTLTVTLAGDATGNLGQKTVDVTIESSEELSNATITVHTVDSDGNLVASGSVSTEGDKAKDTWTGTLSRKMGEFLLTIKGTDRAGNTTTLKGKEDTAKSFGDAGLVAAIDNSLKDATFSLNPKAGKDTETESSNPFAIITFGEEAKEIDGYNEITLTAVTLNGEDVMGQVERASDTVFNIALFDLSVGSHELKYTAMDPAGNSDSATLAFKVNERSPYKVALRPGWNLISVPANPADSMLSAVMGDNAADQVVAYQDGEWLSAVKSDDGTWSGTLEDVMAGYGYWVATRTFQALEVSIPEANPGDSLLPTANVVEGWNLLGVMDPGQTAVPSGDLVVWRHYRQHGRRAVREGLLLRADVVGCLRVRPARPHLGEGQQRRHRLCGERLRLLALRRRGGDAGPVAASKGGGRPSGARPSREHASPGLGDGHRGAPPPHSGGGALCCGCVGEATPHPAWRKRQAPLSPSRGEGRASRPPPNPLAHAVGEGRLARSAKLGEGATALLRAPSPPSGGPGRSNPLAHGVGEGRLARSAKRGEGLPHRRRGRQEPQAGIPPHPPTAADAWRDVTPHPAWRKRQAPLSPSRGEGRASPPREPPPQ